MSTSLFPAVFVSHGSPDLPLQPSPARDFLQQLGQQLGRPKAILCISAHWGTQHPTVSAVLRPKTHHDFGGFPAQLYQLYYPAPGATDLAYRVVELLSTAGIQHELNFTRGLDHGAWIPLSLMYPTADIPVTQLSIQPYQDLAYHLALGRALEPLRQEGFLIVASGTVTHNLWEFGKYVADSPAQPWVAQFADWLTQAIKTSNIEALLNYRELAPYATQNHPSEEHLLPLFVALGAGGETVRGIELHSSFTYGVFSMAAYAFAAAHSLSTSVFANQSL